MIRVESWEKIRRSIFSLLDVLFLLTYIGTIILAILDIFGVLNIVNHIQWTKIIVMVFGTVGMVILADKRKMEVDIFPRIDTILKEQKQFSETEASIDNRLKKFDQILDKEIDIQYFPDKTHFYLYLTELLLKLPAGAKIDVTSFEKNYNVPYDVGEDLHIEAFMKTWTELVKNGRVLVRQLVHVTSPQDYTELEDRIKTFQSYYNFTISTIVGMPIAPFFDYIIVNQEYVVVGMSNDVSSPNNLSFGYVIRSKELALDFQNHFNIYWSSQFSTIIKNKDEIKTNNLKKIQEYVYDIEHNVSIKKYNWLMLGIYHINEHNNKILQFIENLNRFYGNVCYDVLQNDIEDKINECVEFVDKKMNSYESFGRERAAELLSKMIFNAKKNIYAVSLDIDGNEFWETDEGEKVFKSNIDVMSRNGTNIQRVFVCSKEKKEELKETIIEQIQAGIVLYYTEYKQGIGGIFEDFIIIDDEALLILDENTIKVSINHNHISTYYQKFKRIMDMGIKIKEEELC